jgi:hypothetical protein
VTPLRGIACLGLAVAIVAAVAPQFLRMRQPDRIVHGPGVTAERQLSDWFPPLRGGPMDTPVYVLDSGGPGGTLVVLGGTHGDESAGYVAAVVLVEQARVTAGKVIVIPRANASGFTHNLGQEAHPQAFTVDTARGPRTFTCGARVTNPVHQWPDPQVYIHAASGQALSGSETRNLNRAYPGRPNGTLTERLAFAINTLLTRERADLAIDLHEASPEYPVVNTMVAHQRAMDVAALANVALQEREIAIGLEASPEGLRGLSHREWGDATGALAVLAETTNPAQGRLRGRTDAALVTGGRDRFYVAAAERHRLPVPFPAAGWPLTVRVGRHVATVQALADTWSMLTPDRPVTLAGLPRPAELATEGLGSVLRSPGSQEKTR